MVKTNLGFIFRSICEIEMELSNIKAKKTLLSLQFFRLIFLAFIPGITNVTGQAQCVMYDQCGQNPDIPGAKLNCLYSGPPRKVDDDKSFAQLQKYCPELVATFGENLCCSTSQITDLVNNLALPASILGKCPACFYNFRQIFCGIACSPNQFEFLKAKEVVNNAEGRPMVKSLEAYVEDSYVTETFNSCKEVTMPLINGLLALDLMCGPWGAANCTQYKWFDYMGSTENGFAPFDIIHKYIKNDEDEEIVAVDMEEIIPFYFDTIGCSEEFGDDSSPDVKCSCQDCKESCELPEVNFNEGILEINGIYNL